MMDDSNIKSKKYFDNINWAEVKTKRFWYEGEPIITHFMNAISLSIPESERFLVRAIKPYLLKDNTIELAKGLKGFIDDEYSHSLNHTKFNQDLKRHQYPVNFALKFSKFGFNCINRLFSKKTKVAIAVCFEHMTSVIATFGFEHELMKEDVSKIYDLFIWHAFEELNHRSVANDLYLSLGGGYIRRVLSMLYVTFFFITGVSIIQLRFILSDLVARRGIQCKHWHYAFKFFFGKKGLIRGSMRHYLSIYSYKFMP